MNKIGIITLNGYFNYGNRLQNFALQETLKTYDYEVETIWIKKVSSKANSNLLKKVFRTITDLSLILKKINNLRYLNKLNFKRELKFKDFSKEYINETSFHITENYLPQELLSEYDYFVTGSDQVWNPYMTNASSLYFLTFAPERKRISYSPSFGISEIPDEHVLKYKKWLTDMNSISVREEAGATIIKQLTDRDASVLVDPTLLLSKEDWLSVAKPAVNKPKKDILLTYFLGEVPKKTQKLINKNRKIKKLTVVNLANPKYKEFYLTDPSEFLDYISTSKLFMTDSFHGSVFSILFETPFIVTNRKGQLNSMNSRITTLLSIFNLENRHINKVKQKEIFNVDFTHVDPILKEERNRAFEYLRVALSQDK